MRKTVVNATGVFVDSILQMDDPTGIHLVRPSQGVHLVLDRKFLRSEQAVMIPKTDDGRVLFAVPWHNYVVVGTTDTTGRAAVARTPSAGGGDRFHSPYGRPFT